MSFEGGGKPDAERAASALARLLEIMARLRGPDGCPWDREQDMASLRRYTLEEAYEVVQAIDDGDRGALVGELGDLLLQIVFLSQIATEDGDFTIADVADAVADKLVRRHPHVFGELDVVDADEVLRNWEAMKHRERGGGSLLDDVPHSLPALARAQKLGKRAAQMEFDWDGPDGVMNKVREELEELGAALDRTSREEELGDVIFALAQLARHLGVSAEIAAGRANAKFERRFRRLEAEVAAAGGLEGHPDALEAAWERAKAGERGPADDSGH